MSLNVPPLTEKIEAGAQMVSVHFFASRTRSNRLGK